MANEAAEFVLQKPDLFDELHAGLSESDDVIRGRAADALEKVARARPDLLVDRLRELIAVLESDKLAMVRWHVAMILGHLACYEEVVEQVAPTLLRLLEDGSVFVRSWAIVSLCIIGRKYPGWKEQIVNQVGLLQSDSSAAIRSKVR
jgi:HEAT repeat protein